MARPDGRKTETAMAVKTLSYKRWRAMIESADLSPASKSAVPNGYSPGGAAAELGISRQAVHKAMREGRLDAFHIPAPDSNRSGYYLIPQKALDAFKRHRKQRLTA